MKKSLIFTTLAASLFASNVFAETSTNTQEQQATQTQQDVQAQQPQAQEQSTLYLSVYDVSGKVPVALNKLEISRSSKNHQLCWVAQGTFTPKVQTTEIFTAPAKISFNISSELGSVTSSADKKTHTVSSIRDSLNDGKVVVNCWKFDQKDPRGKYSLFVKLGDMEYGPLNFTVVK